MADELKHEAVASIDPFKEFEDDSSPIATAPQGAPKFIQEVDLGDGRMVFEADTVKELASKIVSAQNERFNKRILSEQLSAEPEVAAPTIPYREVPELSQDELNQMAMNWNVAPDLYVQRIIESKFGMTFDDIAQQLGELNSFRFNSYLDNIGTAFVERHSDDYYFCPENANAMITFLDRNGLQYTPQNYEYAFNVLKSANALRPAPMQDKMSGSTAMSGYDNAGTSGGDLTVEDAIKQAQTMDLDELKRSINSRRSR